MTGRILNGEYRILSLPLLGPHPFGQARGDRDAHSAHEFVARGEGRRIDRIVEDNVSYTGMDALAAFGQHCFRSVDRDGNARRACGLSEKEWAFLEGQHTAVRRASALNKCGDVDAFVEDALSFSDAALCVGGIAAAVDCDELALAETRAGDRKIHKRA